MSVKRVARRFASLDGAAEQDEGGFLAARAVFDADGIFLIGLKAHVPRTRCHGRCRMKGADKVSCERSVSWWPAHGTKGFDLAQESELSAATLTDERFGFGEIGRGFADLT